MKQYLMALILINSFHIGYCQNKPENDSLFSEAVFEEAKINNQDAWIFFMHFPYSSNVDGRDGNVFVSFIVRKDGKIDSIQILNNPGELYKSTALDALYKSSGEWNPCNFDGIRFDKKYISGFNFTKTASFFYKKDKSLKYLRRGRTEKALSIINQALKINPLDIELYQFRARIYRKQNKHDLEMLDLAKIDNLNDHLLFNIWF